MKKFAKLSYILILIFMALTLLIACNKTPEGGGNGGSGGSGGSGGNNPPVTKPLDKTIIFDTIKNGLLLSGKANDRAEYRYMKSKANIIVDEINLTVYYEANYNRKRVQDSQILLKFVDEQASLTKIMIYYDKGNLYTVQGTSKTVVEEFGSTSGFDTFLSFISVFDLQTYVFDATFSDALSQLSILTDANLIKKITLAENKFNINIAEINLDQLKEAFNTFIGTSLGRFGTKLDVISNEIFGFKFSTLAEIEAGRLDAKDLQFNFTDNAVTKIDITFGGIQTNYTSEFKFNLILETFDVAQTPSLSKHEDPDYPGVKYEKIKEGQSHYKGTIVIPMFDSTFNIDIKTNLNQTDNLKNKFSVVGSTDTNDVFSLYYGNETLYLDATELINKYIGKGILLDQLNLPKIKTDKLNVATEMSKLMQFIQSMAGEFDDSSLPTIVNGSEIFEALIKRLETNGNTISLTIDKELISKIIGDETNLIEYFAELLGVDSALLEAFFGDENFENALLILSYNVKTKAIGVELKFDSTTLFLMNLYGQNLSGNDVEITPPVGFDPDSYKDFKNPEVVSLSIDADVNLQDKESQDLSRFFGVFMGDTTGVNSKMNMKIDQTLNFNFKITEKNQAILFNGTISLNDLPILKVRSNVNNANEILIDNYILNVRYKLSLDVIKDSFNDLLGENNGLTTGNVLELFKSITKNSSIKLGMEAIEIYITSSKSEIDADDPLYNIFGVRNLYANAKAVISFDDLSSEINDSDSQGYEFPTMVRLENKEVESMYMANWHEYARVTFSDSVVKDLKLSFIGDSAKLVSGKYVYTPTANLLGLKPQYTMIIKDTENGTKIIKGFPFELMTIDPSADNPIPQKIQVVYEDDSIGLIEYQIENFAYNNENIGKYLIGQKAKSYEIIIGKNSIAETSLKLDIEILNRQIKTTSYYGEVPIVDEITIDPYDFAMKYEQNNSYNPFVRNLTLAFGSNNDASASTYVYIENFAWKFDTQKITYVGGKFYAIAKYNNLEIALQVNILAKVVDRVEINTENPNTYTVDMLQNNTYTIPTISNENTEIRIYFKNSDNRYRIIGELGYQRKPWGTGIYEGMFNVPLVWSPDKANSLKINGTAYPFNGTSGTTVADFGNAYIGTQRLSLSVTAPSRSVDVSSNALQVDTYYETDSSGQLDPNKTVTGFVNFSKVALSETGNFENGDTFILNPYEKDPMKRRLPSFIYMKVKVDMTQSDGKYEIKKYPIRWKDSAIIDALGNVKFPQTNEAYMLAVGVIGDNDNHTQDVSVRIHNTGGKFESVDIVDNNTGLQMPVDELGNYVMTGYPYGGLNLPKEFTLKFSDESGILPQKYIITSDKKWELMINNTFLAIDDDYKFPFTGGVYYLKYFIESEENGILGQELTIKLILDSMHVVDNTIFGLIDRTGNNIVVDQYTAESQTLLNNIDKNIVELLFSETGAKRFSNIPVSWENYTDIKNMLVSNGLEKLNGILSGKIYKGTVLEQTVKVSISVMPREVMLINLIGITSADIQNGIISQPEVNIENKIITINLLKPYALRDNLGNNVNPSIYFNNVLSTIRLSFGGAVNEYSPEFDQLGEAFDKSIYNFGIGGQNNSVTVVALLKLSAGSAVERFEVRINTEWDRIKTTTLNNNVDTFGADGLPIFTYGYNVDDTAAIEYEKSGQIGYTKIKWFSTDDYSNFENGFGRDQEVSLIPGSVFLMKTGRIVKLYGFLPSGQRVSKEFNFLKKDIKSSNYNAVADDVNYEIKNGVITVRNIYDVFPFNSNKIPKYIIPNASQDYVSNEKITFQVQFKPLPMFAASEDAFSQEKLNLVINYNGTQSPVIIGEYILRGHNNETQTITVSVMVNALESDYISMNDLTFVDGKASVDPYSDAFGAMNENFVLPKNISVTFKNGLVKQFEKDSNIVHYLVKNKGTSSEVREKITNIPFNYMGHSLPGVDADADVNLVLLLPDGMEIEYTLNFMSRVFSRILIENYSSKKIQNPQLEIDTLLDALYYIDPYNKVTFTVPSKGQFLFENQFGEAPLSKDIVWKIPTNAPFKNVNNKWVFDDSLASGYFGGEYIFSSQIDSANSSIDPQKFTIKVVVLNRALKTGVNQYSFNFSNPIKALIKDLPSAIEEDEFVVWNDVYGKYFDISAPVVPSVEWKIKDNDLSINGLKDAMFEGNVAFGGVKGEVCNITINSPKWTFIRVVLVTKTIVIDPFTKLPKFSDYVVEFSNESNQTIRETFVAKSEDIKYDSNNNIIYDDRFTAIIDFGKDINPSELKTIKIGNLYKDEKILDNNYSYVLSQVTISMLDFGYGYGISGEAKYIIDPFNPVIESRAKAKIKDNTTGDVTDVGYIDLSWNDSIFTLLNGQSKTVTVMIQTSESLINFSVVVYYIKREVSSINTIRYTDKADAVLSARDEVHYSTQRPSVVDGVLSTAPLKQKVANGFNSFFRFDPIGEKFSEIIDSNGTKRFILPAVLMVNFVPDPNYTHNLLSNSFYITDMNWTLSKEITINGTPDNAPIDARFKNYKVYDAKSKVKTNLMNNMFDDLSLNLKVENRSVEETNISSLYNDTINNRTIQKAFGQYSIDPYIYALKKENPDYEANDGYFPSDIFVKFKGDPTTRAYKNIKWILEVEDYVIDPSVYGSVYGSPKLNFIAYFMIEGAKVEVVFTIRSRYIDLKTEGGNVTQAIKGGKLYLLQGGDLIKQLPENLYYQFSNGGLDEMAYMPLTFIESNLKTINVNKVGIYSNIYGQLGALDENNIVFDVEVISPQIYQSLNLSDRDEGTLGNMLFDRIVVAKDNLGNRVEGKETANLPAFVQANPNAFMKIESIQYLPKENIAKVTCIYDFLTEASDFKLSNDKNGSRTRKITFNVPLDSYNYLSLMETPKFKVNVYEHTLGARFVASEMPLAYDKNDNAYPVMWDLTNVNINKAGIYTVIGYVKNNITDIGLEMQIKVNRSQIAQSDVVISESLLTTTYTGIKQNIIPTIRTFIRSDGSVGEINFKLLFSENNIDWLENEPVEAGRYSLKVLIEDYNVEGEVIFNYTVLPKVILPSNVNFYKDESLSSTNLSYEFNNRAKNPYMTGFENAVLKTIYFIYVDGAYRQIEAMINVGIYRIQVEVPNQKNFTANGEIFIRAVEITVANVQYNVAPNIVYSGRSRHCEITNLPENYSAIGITISFQYTSVALGIVNSPDMIRDVGSYTVNVIINGGKNYPSAIINNAYFSIRPKDLTISIGNIKTEYLAEVRQLNSAISLSGLVGDDNASMFSEFTKESNIISSSAITNISMIGNYSLNFRNQPSAKNYNITVVPGKYEIIAENALVVKSVAELTQRIANLKTGDDVRWYLEAGNYGEIVLRTEATVSIYGSYNAAGEVAVSFGAIVVEKGALLIDIIKFNPLANRANLTIKKSAGSVTIERCLFSSVGSNYITASKAIFAEDGYKGTVYIKNIKVNNYTSAVYILSGNVEVSNSTFFRNLSGVYVGTGKATFINNTFTETKGDGIYLSKINQDVILSANIFVANGVGIRTITAMEGDVYIQNTFLNNAINIFYI